MPRTNVYQARKGTLLRRASGLGQEVTFRSKQLSKQLDQLFTKMGAGPVEAGDFFDQLVSALFSDIVRDTPVDTGKARGAWEINFIKKDDTSTKVRISNSVDYIVFLEFGSSRQAPNGMVRINIEKFRGKVSDIKDQVVKALKR